MRAVLLVAFAGCGYGNVDNPPGDGSTSDGATGCHVFISFEDPVPPAGPDAIVRAFGIAEDAPGVLQYTWTVRHENADVTTTPAQPDNSQVTFLAATSGVYEVSLRVDGSINPCTDAFLPLTVRAPGANEKQYRLRVTPAASQTLPPLDRRMTVFGGGNADLGAVVLDPGIEASANVGGEAYVKLMPLSGKDAFVEAFADASGQFTTQVLDQPHEVLVVPKSAALAPKKIATWMPGDPIAIDGGTAVTGTVRDPANAPIAGAKVQLWIGDVPSTLATTDAAGSFTVRANLAAGATVKVDVAPAVSTGLPRLVASATTFDLPTTPIAVRYAAALATRDLANTQIRRGGSAVANAKVSFVATLASIGTVTAGGSAAASGEVRIAASADAAGRLPSVRAPARPLSAVVEVAAGDLAVTAIDLTGGVPATIDAPAMRGFTTALENAARDGLPGALLDAVPVGALAQAGAPTVRFTAGTDGAVTGALASSGHYDLRMFDPGRRAAPRIEEDKTATEVLATYLLGKAISITGRLVVSGSSQPIPNAAVQILCATCTGVERSRPLAETGSRLGGEFEMAVPDPGTN